jgi:phosphate transport system substrate-binding protein
MGFVPWRAAVFAALLIPGAGAAQDVTLTARDGGLELVGTLQGWDGEFYRISTSYGLLTVDGQGVICDGPGCPDLTAPRIPVRIVGEAEPTRQQVRSLPSSALSRCCRKNRGRPFWEGGRN